MEMNQIEILFKEYDTLRAEAISRGDVRYQLATVAAALTAGGLTWLASNFSSNSANLMFICVAFVLFLAIMFTLWQLAIRDIDFIASRLVEVESEINQFAGKELLKWETHWGSHKTGYICRRRPATTDTASVRF